jgi:hypothetical protein
MLIATAMATSVGEDVLAVRHQRHRVRPPARPDQRESEPRIDEGEQTEADQARVEMTHLGALPERAGRLHEDQDRRHGDQRALHARGEELHLAVSVGMVAIRWPSGDDQAVEQQRRRHHVDDRLERVREHGGRARGGVHAELAEEDQQAEPEREPARAQADGLVRGSPVRDRRHSPSAWPPSRAVT